MRSVPFPRDWTIPLFPRASRPPPGTLPAPVLTAGAEALGPLRADDRPGQVPSPRACARVQQPPPDQRQARQRDQQHRGGNGRRGGRPGLHRTAGERGVGSACRAASTHISTFRPVARPASTGISPERTARPAPSTRPAAEEYPNSPSTPGVGRGHRGAQQDGGTSRQERSARCWAAASLRLAQGEGREAWLAAAPIRITTRNWTRRDQVASLSVRRRSGLPSIQARSPAAWPAPVHDCPFPGRSPGTAPPPPPISTTAGGRSRGTARPSTSGPGKPGTLPVELIRASSGWRSTASPQFRRRSMSSAVFVVGHRLHRLRVFLVRRHPPQERNLADTRPHPA